MTRKAPIYCAGSVLWDTIGRTPRKMAKGQDLPGWIRRVPGGVAMNIAMAMRAHGLDVSLLTVLGDDPEGRALMDAAQVRGIATDLIFSSGDCPTDQYMAIESKDGLVAAVADAHTLEKRADAALAPLYDDRLGGPLAPFGGMLVIEGNLPLNAMDAALADGVLDAADLRLAPASPGKATRMRLFLDRPGATLYVNLIEANLILDQVFETSSEAAVALIRTGLGRAVVTDGTRAAAIATRDAVLTGLPDQVLVRRVTGAGDVFMACHIAAELKDAAPQAALDQALRGAADYVSSETPL